MALEDFKLPEIKKISNPIGRHLSSPINVIPSNPTPGKSSPVEINKINSPIGRHTSSPIMVDVKPPLAGAK